MTRRFSDSDLLGNYCLENGYDEIAWYLGIEFNTELHVRVWPACCASVMVHDIHHIFTNPRRDLQTNLIAICRDTHRWGHDKNTNGLRLLSLAAKLAKRQRTGDEMEFELEALSVCAGGRNIVGMVECYEFEEPWLRDIQAKFVREAELVVQGIIW